jgi:hypothetical protein
MEECYDIKYQVLRKAKVVAGEISVVTNKVLIRYLPVRSGMTIGACKRISLCGIS